MLRVESWNKSFGSNHVLRDISVTVGTGETVTIIGASGSGKSTFLRTLTAVGCTAKALWNCAATPRWCSSPSTCSATRRRWAM